MVNLLAIVNQVILLNLIIPLSLGDLVNLMILVNLVILLNLVNLVILVILVNPVILMNLSAKSYQYGKSGDCGYCDCG